MVGLVSVIVTVILLFAFFFLWRIVNPDTVENQISFIRTFGTIVGGAALLLGLLFTGLNLRVNREGQITERFTQAIDQLGRVDDKGKVLEVRLGGIYALERIARDSERDHWPIMEVLTAYVRQHSPRQPKGETSKEATEGESGDPSTVLPSNDHVAVLDADLQAIISVIRRRTRYHGKSEPPEIDLHDTNLQIAYLSGAYLRGARLWGANLQLAFLQLANLREADLWEADLREAGLQLADLRGADLRGADLRGAFIQGADLRNTQDLTQEQLDSATGDGGTRLPDHLEAPSSWPKGASLGSEYDKYFKDDFTS